MLFYFTMLLFCYPEFSGQVGLHRDSSNSWHSWIKVHVGTDQIINSNMQQGLEGGNTVFGKMTGC